VAAGFDSLVDTDSELEQVDVEDEVKLEPELQKRNPRKPRTRKNESLTKPPVVRQLPSNKRVLPLAASGARTPATDKLIGTMSTPANEETRKPPPKIKGKKTSPPRTCNDKTVRATVEDSSAQETTTPSTVERCVGLPSVKDIAPLAKICANAFRRRTLEQAKEEVMWTVFRMLHDQSPTALVLDMMTIIRRSLEQEQPSVVIGKLGKRDICGGSRPPRTYLQRTSECATQYNKVMGWDNKRNLLKNIVLALRKEGFRFVEEGQGKHGGWQEMSIDSAIGIVRRRMQRLKENSERSNQLLGKLDVPPGPLIEMEGAPEGRATMI
jgi:hypothetical protein